MIALVWVCCIAPLMYILMNGFQGTIIWKKLRVETEMESTNCTLLVRLLKQLNLAHNYYFKYISYKNTKQYGKHTSMHSN